MVCNFATHRPQWYWVILIILLWLQTVSSVPTSRLVSLKKILKEWYTSTPLISPLRPWLSRFSVMHSSAYAHTLTGTRIRTRTRTHCQVWSTACDCFGGWFSVYANRLKVEYVGGCRGLRAGGWERRERVAGQCCQSNEIENGYRNITKNQPGTKTKQISCTNKENERTHVHILLFDEYLSLNPIAQLQRSPIAAAYSWASARWCRSCQCVVWPPYLQLIWLPLEWRHKPPQSRSRSRLRTFPCPLGGLRPPRRDWSREKTGAGHVPIPRDGRQ